MPDQINRAKELWTVLLNELPKSVDTVIIDGMKKISAGSKVQVGSIHIARPCDT